MKNYDCAKVRKLIQENAENLTEASMGMHEDWFWTAETVWENGTFTESFLALENSTDKFGGIIGSQWATPALSLRFQDGTEKMLECFSGESDTSAPPFPIDGCMSGPVQENIPPLEKAEEAV